MGPSVAHAPIATRWRPIAHQLSLFFMSHALSAKHRRCVLGMLAAGEKCSSHGDELLLAAAAHRGRCISTATSRCRRQHRRRHRFSVDLAVLYGSWLLLLAVLQRCRHGLTARPRDSQVLDDATRPGATRGTAGDRQITKEVFTVTCFTKALPCA